MEKHPIDILTEESEEEIRIKNGELLNRKIYSSGEDFIVNEARLFGRESDISVRTHTRYTDFPEHKHSYVEMMIVLSGSIKHKVKDKVIELKEGEILILNRHISHSIERSGKEDIGVNVIMSDRFISAMAHELSGTVFSSLIKENAKHDGEPMYLYFHTGGSKRIQNVIENLLFELTDQKPEMSVMSRTVSLLLSYLSLGNTELLISGSISRDKESSRRMEILSYVRNNYRTATLGELSRRLYLSTPYLSRLVAEYFGKSFKELVVDERMQMAYELFTTSALPIGDVIRSVGYENESYFHREFKKRYLLTPLALRKKSKIPLST